MDITSVISKTLKISAAQIDATIKLLNEGATVPFIANVLSAQEQRKQCQR